MRCLFSLIMALVGLLLLGAGGFLLYTSLIDEPDSRVETLGGASSNQEQIAAASAGGTTPELEVVLNGNPYPASAVQRQLALDPDSVADLAVIDEQERTAVREQTADSEITTEIQRQATSATTGEVTASQSNVVLENQTLTADSEISVIPLSAGGRTGIDGTSSMPDGLSGSGGAGLEPVEQRVVEFEWPEEFRSGESGVLRLKLKALPQGGIEVSVPEIPTNAIISTPILLTDCYDYYDAQVLASVIAPEFDVESSATNPQLLTRGGEATWRWTLTPDKDGTFAITVALKMTWTPRTGSSGVSTATCSALANNPFTFWGQSVQVEVNKVFGLITIPQASVLGTVLAVVGFIGELPIISGLLVGMFERRLERRADRRRQKRARRRR